MPKGKGVVLGLVSSKSAVMETRAEIERRVGEAAKVLPLDQLGVGPQCGFASTVAGNPVTEDVQRAKLKLCVEVAKAVWGRA